MRASPIRAWPLLSALLLAQGACSKAPLALDAEAVDARLVTDDAGPASDAGPVDAGAEREDARADAAADQDASGLDATTDAGLADASGLDATTDAGPADASDAGADAGPCAQDPDCDDGDPATQDVCFQSSCFHVDVCDRDQDHVRDDTCGGPDCRPQDPAVPGPSEVCMNNVDDDCNGLTDGADPACRATNERCSAALDVSAGGQFNASTVGAAADYPGCGPDLAYRFSLSAPKVARFGLSVPAPPSGQELSFNVFVGPDCPPSGGRFNSCYCAGSALCLPYPAAIEVCHRLSAGDGYAIVQLGSRTRSDGAEATLDVSFSDPPSPACGARDDVSAGGSFPVAPSDPRWVNAYGDCSGSGTKEALYALSTTVAKNVLITAGDREGELYLLPGCGTSTTPLPLVEPQFTLPPGSYTVVQELGPLRGAQGDLRVRFPEPERSCAAAAPINGTGTFAGDTTGGPNRLVAKFGDGEGPERVYRLNLSARTRVVSDLIPNFSGAILYLQSRCGETASTDYLSFQRTHLDRVLEPGTHYVVIDGRAAGDAGSYVLNVTFLP